jgi:hypothetical protein
MALDPKSLLHSFLPSENAPPTNARVLLHHTHAKAASSLLCQLAINRARHNLITLFVTYANPHDTPPPYPVNPSPTGNTDALLDCVLVKRVASIDELHRLLIGFHLVDPGTPTPSAILIDRLHDICVASSTSPGATPTADSSPARYGRNTLTMQLTGVVALAAHAADWMAAQPRGPTASSGGEINHGEGTLVISCANIHEASTLLSRWLSHQVDIHAGPAANVFSLSLHNLDEPLTPTEPPRCCFSCTDEGLTVLPPQPEAERLQTPSSSGARRRSEALRRS